MRKVYVLLMVLLSLVLLTSCGGSSSSSDSTTDDDTDTGTGTTITEVEPNNGTTIDDVMDATPPVTITGDVYYDGFGTTDEVDFFTFTPTTTKSYTFTLSFNGANYNNDIDLFGIVNGSIEYSPIDAPYDGTTESITVSCDAGVTQYVVVGAFYTIDNPTAYTLTIK